MVLWGGMVHKYTMLKVFSIKIHIMVIQTSFRLSKWDFLFFWVLEFEVIELGPFGFDPGFEQLLITAARSTFQIQKAQSGSGRTSTPPFGSSRVRGDRAWAFWFRPRIRAAVNNSCQEHFSDPKCPIGKWSNFNPPFWEFSRKVGHARSRPQP